MNSSRIGKIEKAQRYAHEPERLTLTSFQARFHGSHDDYDVTLSGDGWTCTCHTFQAEMVESCSHVMAVQRLLNPMLEEEARFGPRSLEPATTAIVD